jgi:hypothetical protein
VTVTGPEAPGETETLIGTDAPGGSLAWVAPAIEIDVFVI